MDIGEDPCKTCLVQACCSKSIIFGGCEAIRDRFAKIVFGKPAYKGGNISFDPRKIMVQNSRKEKRSV